MDSGMPKTVAASARKDKQAERIKRFLVLGTKLATVVIVCSTSIAAARVAKKGDSLLCSGSVNDPQGKNNLKTRCRSHHRKYIVEIQ